MEHTRPNGTVGIGLIAVMVMIEMIVIVSVVNGSLTNNMMLKRIDINQAFYTAEAGIALAVREKRLNIDEDGDGTIGSISDDANAANDPTIGSGTVHVIIFTNPGNSIPLNLDNDGDETIGSISDDDDDGDDADGDGDSTTGSGTVHMSILTNPGNSILTAYGKSNLAHRTVKRNLSP